MELCSGGRVHQPVRDRGGERPAHGEAAPSLGVDAQVLCRDSLSGSIMLDCKLYLRHEYLQQPFNFGSIQSLYICLMIADYINCAENLATASQFQFKSCARHTSCVFVQ